MLNWLRDEPQASGWSKMPRWQIAAILAGYFIIPWLTLGAVSGGTAEHFKISAIVVGVIWAIIMLALMPKRREDK